MKSIFNYFFFNVFSKILSSGSTTAVRTPRRTTRKLTRNPSLRRMEMALSVKSKVTTHAHTCSFTSYMGICHFGKVLLFFFFPFLKVSVDVMQGCSQEHNPITSFS